MKRLSDFRLLATGMTLSWLGGGFQPVALAVAVLVAGGGARDLGLVMASTVLAMVASTLFGGVWADRVQPTHLMIGSDLVRFAATGGMAVMFATGTYHLAALCTLAAVSSSAGSFFAPAMTALKPMLVPPERRAATNATMSLLQAVCTVIGPALGGVVVAAFGAPAGFAVNAVSFLASLAAAALIRARAQRVAARDGMLRELGAGWREIRRRDWLLSGVFAATAYHVANGVVFVLIQVVAVQRLGGAHALGLIGSAEGVGGVIGAALAIRLTPRRPLRAGWLALLLMPVWVLSYVWPAVLVAVLAGAATAFAALSFFSVAWETALQNHIPHHTLGRVASWDQLTSFIAMPLGNALAGPLSDTFGINPVLVVCAGVMLAASAAPLFVPGTHRLTRTAIPEPGAALAPSTPEQQAAAG